ncbi:MAG: STAS domain-containing protein [Bdellovibrionia bacterium]
MNVQHKIIQTKAAGPTLVISPVGDIDMHESPKLRTVVLSEIKKKPKAVVVDLSQVGFIDSSGIATLVEALKEAKNIGAPFTLCGMSEKIMDVFELARLDKVFKIAGTLKEITGA